MKNLLIGNGLLIQYGGTDYTNKSIILRTLENLEKKDFPSHIIIDNPVLIKIFFGLMIKCVPDILKGKYDHYANCSAEVKSLKSFKENYKDKLNTGLQISDIGFEYYYLIYDLVSHKINMQNPERYQGRETLKTSFLHSIYNTNLPSKHV